ncbi:MAG: hypothetical protein A3K45_05490 [Chloroflexi bacterium RIFOXYC12_FULL_59_14]|nr:MAG: hypothetical protein A3K45_05490 [Chloroflexi bacterium RIFOXYC12_FULL_59_14]
MDPDTGVLPEISSVTGNSRGTDEGFQKTICRTSHDDQKWDENAARAGAPLRRAKRLSLSAKLSW